MTRLRRRERFAANLVLLALLLFILGACLSVFSSLASTRPSGARLNRGMMVAGWAAGGGAAVVLPVAFFIHVFSRIDRRRAIESHRWLVCRRCSYPLDGCLPEGRCPECGDPYHHERLAREWKRHFRVVR